MITKKWSIKYNKICLKEKILPNYTRLRLHNPVVMTTNTTMEYRKYLITKQIEENEKSIRFLTNKCDKIVEKSIVLQSMKTSKIQLMKHLVLV